MITISSKVKFIERFLGSARLAPNSKNLEVRCPFCDPKDPTKKKLSIRLLDDMFHCWVCNANGRSLLFLLKKFGTQEMLDEYLNTFRPELKRKTTQTVEVESKPEFKLPNDYKLLVTAQDGKDPEALMALKYLLTRGVTKRDLWYFKFGISNQMRWYRRALMPSFDVNGNPNYLVARSIDPKRFPKYNTPLDVEKKDLIFNEINIDWSQQLVLCEGVFDLIKCPDNTIPLLGSSLNEQSALFEKIVVNNTPIILALDADMRLTNSISIAKKLMEYQINVRIMNVSTDPGEMQKEEVLKAIVSARSMDWFQFISSRLEYASQMSLR